MEVQWQGNAVLAAGSCWWSENSGRETQCWLLGHAGGAKINFNQ